QETQRAAKTVAVSAMERQFIETARCLGLPREDVERTIVEWMFRRPLKYLRYCRRRGLVAFLSRLRRDGIAAGVLSDYPVRDKLAALGVCDRFSIAICTTDPEVNALKPHPAGFL